MSWRGKNDLKTLRVDADFLRKRRKKNYVFKNIRIRVNRQNQFENSACGRGFFSNTGEKNLHFQKYSQADKSNSASQAA